MSSQLARGASSQAPLQLPMYCKRSARGAGSDRKSRIGSTPSCVFRWTRSVGGLFLAGLKVGIRPGRASRHPVPVSTSDRAWRSAPAQATARAKGDSRRGDGGASQVFRNGSGQPSGKGTPAQRSARRARPELGSEGARVQRNCRLRRERFQPDVRVVGRADHAVATHSEAGSPGSNRSVSTPFANSARQGHPWARWRRGILPIRLQLAQAAAPRSPWVRQPFGVGGTTSC